MKVLVTGANGFAGSALIHAFRESGANLELIGIDNLSRPGSETNRARWRELGVRVFHGDIRLPSDVDALPSVDWVIDAAANPSVLAGLTADSSPRQLIEHNLLGTVNLLEFCRRIDAGFLLLSTSRVYSIDALSSLPLAVENNAYLLRRDQPLPVGVGPGGITETFSTAAPISLYGATKLASEALALEYGASLGLPVWINRCGLLAGAGQFGRPDQGILAYWINAYLRRAPLKYLGFGGSGAQVRAALHPRDLAALVLKQMGAGDPAGKPRAANVSGGDRNSFSLARISAWCRERFGFEHAIAVEPEIRAADLPWLVLDSSAASKVWAWHPESFLPDILAEIASHAEQHPDWLARSAAG